MLLELAVENYAVVDRLRLAFHPGFNLLTGETGSGKSIIVGALGLLFGARASTEVIRSGESKARVSGRFDAGTNIALEAVLQAAGFETEDGELLIEREILPGGKSRVYLGSRPATAALLKDIAPFLGDIHGQHDQQLLFSPDAQCGMLDAFAGNTDTLARLQHAYKEWRAVVRDLEELERGEQDKLRQLDVWQFQRGEIRAASLKPGEDTTLDEERRVQQNVGRLLENTGAAYTALYDSPESAYSAIKSALRKLEELTRIDSSLAEIRQSLDPAVIAVQEASYALRDYLGKLEANPARLDEIESRLALIERLKRKYGGTLDATLAFLEDVERRLSSIENAGARIESLRASREKFGKVYEAEAAALTKRRQQAAAKLERAVERELASLAMEGTVFRIQLEPAEWSETGADATRFLVSANRGEEPKPMEKIASGGEISRIALALKSCLVESVPPVGAPRTLVFDEVDTGIGGSAAEGVGRRLLRLSGASQVLCVTHLAQVACFADHHFLVEKAAAGERTTTRVNELDINLRREEIARMISGEKLTPEAIQHASQLIDGARSR